MSKFVFGRNPKIDFLENFSQLMWIIPFKPTGCDPCDSRMLEHLLLKSISRFLAHYIGHFCHENDLK